MSLHSDLLRISFIRMRGVRVTVRSRHTRARGKVRVHLSLDDLTDLLSLACDRQGKLLLHIRF